VELVTLRKPLALKVIKTADVQPEHGVLSARRLKWRARDSRHYREIGGTTRLRGTFLVVIARNSQP
jgi:hypothetical protein